MKDIIKRIIINVEYARRKRRTEEFNRKYNIVVSDNKCKFHNIIVK